MGVGEELDEELDEMRAEKTGSRKGSVRLGMEEPTSLACLTFDEHLG